MSFSTKEITIRSSIKKSNVVFESRDSRITRQENIFHYETLIIIERVKHKELVRAF